MSLGEGQLRERKEKGEEREEERSARGKGNERGEVGVERRVMGEKVEEGKRSD